MARDERDATKLLLSGGRWCVCFFFRWGFLISRGMFG